MKSPPFGTNAMLRKPRTCAVSRFETYAALYIEMGMRQDIHAPKDRIQTNYAFERTQAIEVRKREIEQALEEASEG